MQHDIVKRKPRIGSVCSGYGGLDMAVQQVFDADVAWFFEFESAPSKVLAHHWPEVPNYGDLTAADWHNIERVDIMCGGTPCQDLSGAGKRKGMTEGTRSNLWVQMREGIAIQRPAVVIWENVRGAYSARADSEVEREPGLLGDGTNRPALRALGRVLGDLSSLGYDSKWLTVQASDVGAPHPRARVFVVAELANVGQERAGSSWDWRSGFADDDSSTANNRGLGSGEGDEPAELGTARADWAGVLDEHRSGRTGMVWGKYERAIRRWEKVLGRSVPAPAEPTGPDGGMQLSAKFCEWFMGVDEGHVTDPAIGLSKNQQIKALGNGVVTQQAVAAISQMVSA